MKSLALFLTMCVLFTFTSSFNAFEEVSLERSNSCKSKCDGCQNTVYDFKFNNIADCNNSKCRDTVIFFKISASKSSPSGVQ